MTNNEKIITILQNEAKEARLISEAAHRIHTPVELVREMLSKIDTVYLHCGDILVLFNLEFLLEMRELGVDMNGVTYYSDDDFKSKAAAKIGVKVITELPMNKKFDVVIGNPPYNQANGDFAKTATIWENFVGWALDNSEIVAMIVPFSLGRSGKFANLRDRINNTGLVNYRFLTQKDFSNVKVNTLYFVCDKNADLYTQDVWHSSKTLEDIIAKIEAKVGKDYYNDKSLHLKFKGVAESNTDGQVATRLNINGFQLVDGKVDTNYGTHRVFTSYLCNGPKGAHLKVVDVATPDIGLPKGYMSMVVANETVANNIAGYLKTNFSVAIHNLTKTTRGVTGAQTRFIPKMDFNRSWTDADLVAYFGFTADEVQFINDNEFPQG